MRIVKSDNIVCFDVDDTLLMWEYDNDLLFHSKARPINVNGCTVLAHDTHIRKLKEFKAKGHYVIVWSQGGYEWAAEAVKLLRLEAYVDLVICKPKWYVDDNDANNFMRRIYKDFIVYER